MDRPDARSRRSGAAESEEPAGDEVPAGDAAVDRAGREASAWADRLPSNAVAVAIASREHVVVAELPPLFGSVDCDALDAFIRSAPGASATFTHCGYEVNVTGAGTVELTPLKEP